MVTVDAGVVGVGVVDLVDDGKVDVAATVDLNVATCPVDVDVATFTSSS